MSRVLHVYVQPACVDILSALRARLYHRTFADTTRTTRKLNATDAAFPTIEMTYCLARSRWLRYNARDRRRHDENVITSSSITIATARVNACSKKGVPRYRRKPRPKTDLRPFVSYIRRSKIHVASDKFNSIFNSDAIVITDSSRISSPFRVSLRGSSPFLVVEFCPSSRSIILTFRPLRRRAAFNEGFRMWPDLYSRFCSMVKF